MRHFAIFALLVIPIAAITQPPVPADSRASRQERAAGQSSPNRD